MYKLNLNIEIILHIIHIMKKVKEKPLDKNKILKNFIMIIYTKVFI